MAAPIFGLAGLVRREAGVAVGGLATRIALVAVVGLFVTAALGFFVASATVALADEFGAVVATSVVGAIFLALALTVLCIARVRERRQQAVLQQMRIQRLSAFREIAARSTLDGVLGLAGVGQRNRIFLVPIAAAVALGWFAERGARRRS